MLDYITSPAPHNCVWNIINKPDLKQILNEETECLGAGDDGVALKRPQQIKECDGLSYVFEMMS